MNSKKLILNICTCYYFDDMMRVWNRSRYIDFSDILLGEKLYKEKY